MADVSAWMGGQYEPTRDLRRKMAEQMAAGTVKERGAIVPLGTYGDGTTRAAWPQMITEPYEAIARLMSGQYSLGDNNPQKAADAFNASGIAMMGGYAAPKPRGSIGSAGGGKGITAYHGSPHDFDRFSMDKIGTGEGAQAFGHGLYFAENEGVARSYKEALTGVTKNPDVDVANALKFGASLDDIIEMFGRNPDEYSKRIVESARSGSYLNPPPSGRMYEVRINAEPEQFLDWDKPLSQQSEAVQKAVREHPSLSGYKDLGAWNDTEMSYFRDVIEMQSPEAVSRLRDAGIPGIRYLDQGSRTAGEGSRNYVLFRDDIIDIVKKYGVPAAISAYGMDAVRQVYGGGESAEASY